MTGFRGKVKSGHGLPGFCHGCFESFMAGIESGAVFRQVTRHDYVSGTGITPHAVALIIKSAVARTGGDPSVVSGHSLRSGFCTQAAMSDIPNWMVRETTGHTSDAMLNVYCRPVKRRKIPSLL